MAACPDPPHEHDDCLGTTWSLAGQEDDEAVDALPEGVKEWTDGYRIRAGVHLEG